MSNRLSKATLLAPLAATMAFLVLPALAGAQASAKAGRVSFEEYCRSCHGDAARGDGPVAEHLTPKPADLTGIASRNGGTFPTERVVRAISEGRDVDGHGNSEMPVWGSAFTKVRGGQSAEQVDRRILDLVAYLESIQR